MKKTLTCSTLALSLVLAVGMAAHAQDQQEQAADTGFSRFAELAGTWTGAASHHDGPEQVTVTYEVTAGGSAVVETLFVGSDHEMVSVFFNDGDQLVMTHYCMLGNQPTMTAQPAESADTIAFICRGGTNIPDENAQHMHEADYTFIDDDHVTSTWTLYDQGAPIDSTTIELQRAAE